MNLWNSTFHSRGGLQSLTTYGRGKELFRLFFLAQNFFNPLYSRTSWNISALPNFPFLFALHTIVVSLTEIFYVFLSQKKGQPFRDSFVPCSGIHRCAYGRGKPVLLWSTRAQVYLSAFSGLIVRNSLTTGMVQLMFSVSRSVQTSRTWETVVSIF